MNLDIVVIDFINPRGELTSYYVKPKDRHGRVVIDRLSDLMPGYQTRSTVDLGGIRIYNSSDCIIQMFQSMPKRFSLFESERRIFFQLEHIAIPLGPSREGHGGYYNLILPPHFRFTELHIVDPYDTKANRIEKKKHFHYDVLWDTSCNTSLAKMQLRSGRGSFSFIARASAEIYDADSVSAFVSAQETDHGVSGLMDYYGLTSHSKKAFADNLADKSDWLMLQPNFFGLGVNLNAVINSIKDFQKRLRREQES